MKKSLCLLSIILLIFSLDAAWINLADHETKLFYCPASDRSNTELEFKLDGYDLEVLQKEGNEYLHITHPQEGDLLQIGLPDLPVFTTLVAISPQGTPHLNFSASEFSAISDVEIYPRQELQIESEPYRDIFTKNEEYYRSGSIFPETQVFIGEPAIMRDIRIVPVTVCPFRYDPVTKKLIITEEFSIQISMSRQTAANELISHANISKAFLPFYKAHIINYELTASRDEFQQPCILVIHPANTQVAANLAYLTDWKHERGFEIHTASLAETGSTNTAIKNYIQNAYNTWLNRPEYVILAGDVGGSYNIPTWIETWSWYNGEGDQPYSQLAGGDVLADVFLGRMPYGTITELQTLIAKSINYEKSPYTVNENWLENITLVGDPSSSGPSTISTCRYVQELSQDYNPQFSYNEIFSGSFASQMSSAINAGTLHFCYRGYIGMSGFGITNINNLYNGWMLPFVTILTCSTGNFAGTATSEVFARAGTSSNPKGAIAAVGTATSGTHTCFNNCVTAGIYEALFNLDIFSAGGALVNGKYKLFLNYPQNPNNQVNIFSHWNNLMGDPSVTLYTGFPQELNVMYPNEVGLGTLNMPVSVLDAQGFPVEDAWVTILMGDDDIFATGYTDTEGQIWLPLDNNQSGEVTITVTAQDYRSFQDTFNISAQDVQLNPRNYIIDDDNLGNSSGNNNSIINNGETIELDILINNSGSQTASDITASIECSQPLVNIILDEVSYQNIAPGAEIPGEESFIIYFDPAIIDNFSIILNVIISSNGQEFYDILELIVQAPRLSHDEYTLYNVGSVLDPGESAELSVQLHNLGHTDSGILQALLSTANPFLQIDNASAEFANIAPGSYGDNSQNRWAVSLNSTAIPGTMIPFDILLTNDEGFNQTVHFSIDVGTVTVNDPLGPDAYGYLCYDEEDTDYLQAPTYDWIEINPSLGGNGSAVGISTNSDNCEIADINFPPGFTFNFYGQNYSMFTVATAGWIAPGGTQNKSFMNWHLPDVLGPSPMIAAFWDDIYNGSSGGIYTYYDPSMHYFIIEWDHFQNEVGAAEETFQIVLYDANFYPTSTMDSMIKIQYKVFNNVNQGSYRANHGQYCTVGLEDPSGLIGLEYTFNNSYPTAARPITNQSAILFTTMPIPPDGAYLTLGSIILDDENGNGQADYGESIDFDLVLSNIGSDVAGNVTVLVESSDPWITLTSNFSSYPDIPAGNMAANLTPFHLTVDNNAPDGHLAPFTINISCNDGEWQLLTQIVLNAPDLGFLDYMVNDGVDNILDPGETADVLVNFLNNGGAPVYNAQITLSTNDPYLTINNDVTMPGLIPGGNTASGIFSFSAAINSPAGHAATINWSLAAGQNYSAEGSFSFVISQIPVLIDEDFSGTFPPDGWFVSGQNWGSNNSSNAGGSAPEARFNWSPSVTGTQRLVCGPFSTSGSSELDLSFRQNVNHFSGTYSLLVETSSNGSTWQTAASYQPQNQGATLSSVNISNSDVGSPNFYFAFTFSGNSYNINYWYIDNVLIEGVSMEPLGYVSGNVIINGPGNVEDVSISIANQIVHPNIYGEYSVILAPGIYTLTATLAGFDDFVVENLQVIETQITQQNIVLGYIPSPENLTVSAQENGILLEWELSPEETRRLSREIDYFNIYCAFNNGNPVLAGDSVELSYLHEPYLPGEYSYYVTAFYTESGETLPSNTASTWYDGEIHFADVNESSVVDAFDAAIILQYFVGLDPIPDIDPRPWEDWRFYLGDVDGNGNMEAYDASLIVQYIVGIIDHFPCEPRQVPGRIISSPISIETHKK